MCALSFSLFHSLSILSLSLSHNLIESYFSTEKKKMHEEENKQTKKIVPFSREKNNHCNNNNDNNNNNNIVVDFLVVFNVAFVHSFFASSTSPWRSEAPKVESMAVVLFFFCLFPYILKRNSYISSFLNFFLMLNFFSFPFLFNFFGLFLLHIISWIFFFLSF